jgi:hypothetical protein
LLGGNYEVRKKEITGGVFIGSNMAQIIFYGGRLLHGELLPEPSAIVRQRVITLELNRPELVGRTWSST